MSCKLSNNGRKGNKKAAVLLLVACVAVSCDQPKPRATLHFERMYQLPTTTVVEFTANLHIEDLYAKHRHQKVVRKYLKCALGEDVDFAVENKMRYAFEGTLQLHGSFMAGDKNKVRYLSHGDFYELPPQSNNLELLRGQKLVDVVGTKKSVPCKVIMTVYFSSPYYSNTMQIPAADILKTSKAGR